MSYTKRSLAAFTLATLLNGCATTNTTTTTSTNPSTTKPTQLSPDSAQSKTAETPDTTTVSKSKPGASAPTSWSMSGSMAAHHHNKGWTASFNWSQHGADSYQIRLIGPLGGGSVLIARNNGITTFRDGPKVDSARNADKLLQEKTGVAMPVRDLYYWSRGLPAPGPVSGVHRDAENHITSFQQAGFSIEYPSMMQVHGVDLPRKIKLQGNGAIIKVAIKRWNF